MKHAQENKGITLIALVITITVMLILVTVSITVAINGGLFNKAKEVAQRTNAAATSETAMGNEVGSYIDSLIGEHPNNGIEVKSSSINQFDISKIESRGGLINNNDGTLTATIYGAGRTQLSIACPELKVGDTVTFFMTTTSSKKFIYLSGINILVNSGTAITITQDILDSYIAWYCERIDGANYPATISNISFVKGNVPIEPVYEPYQTPTATTDI